MSVFSSALRPEITVSSRSHWQVLLFGFLLFGSSVAVRGEPTSASGPALPAAKVASFQVIDVPTGYIFVDERSGIQPPESRGLAWIDNRRVMFVGFAPENVASRGPKEIHIWDVVANTIGRYSNHERFCYADGNISAWGVSESKGEDGNRFWITPVRHGRLGQEKDGFCDTQKKTGCLGELNMSCKRTEYARDSRPLGENSSPGDSLRSGDGAIVYLYPRGVAPEKRDEYERRPALLHSKRFPKGKTLPFSYLEEISVLRASYSEFSKRYAFVPGRTGDRPRDSNTNWPAGVQTPIYLMTPDGEVETIRVPSYRDWTNIHLALPVVPGLVFLGSGGYDNSWGGVFLYDKHDVSVVDRGRATALAVSPDGCKAAYTINNDYGKKPGPGWRSRIKIVRFCKGDE